MASDKVIVARANESHMALLKHRIMLFFSDDEIDLAGQSLSGPTDEELGTRLSQSARALCVREYSSSRIGPKTRKYLFGGEQKVGVAGQSVSSRYDHREVLGNQKIQIHRRRKGLCPRTLPQDW
jgi:hypothetical protein